MQLDIIRFNSEKRLSSKVVYFWCSSSYELFKIKKFKKLSLEKGKFQFLTLAKACSSTSFRLLTKKDFVLNWTWIWLGISKSKVEWTRYLFLEKCVPKFLAFFMPSKAYSSTCFEKRPPVKRNFFLSGTWLHSNPKYCSILTCVCWRKLCVHIMIYHNYAVITEPIITKIWRGLVL